TNLFFFNSLLENKKGCLLLRQPLYFIEFCFFIKLFSIFQSGKKEKLISFRLLIRSRIWRVRVNGKKINIKKYFLKSKLTIALPNLFCTFALDQINPAINTCSQ